RIRSQFRQNHLRTTLQLSERKVAFTRVVVKLTDAVKRGRRRLSLIEHDINRPHRAHGKTTSQETKNEETICRCNDGGLAHIRRRTCRLPRSSNSYALAVLRRLTRRYA